MDSIQPFLGFETKPTGRPLVVVDLGYSANQRSCGLAWTGASGGVEVQFGQAVVRTQKLLAALESPVLVLEAVLSTYHRADGNPDLRGDFERGRGWYWGAGVLTFAAALRFLKVLGQRLPPDMRVWIAEAFLSNKSKRASHADDAMEILWSFWRTVPEQLRDGVEPASELIQGVPSIRVFRI